MEQPRDTDINLLSKLGINMETYLKIDILKEKEKKRNEFIFFLNQLINSVKKIIEKENISIKMMFFTNLKNSFNDDGDNNIEKFLGINGVYPNKDFFFNDFLVPLFGEDLLYCNVGKTLKELRENEDLKNKFSEKFIKILNELEEFKEKMTTINLEK